MKKVLTAVWLASFAGCTCGSKSNGPLVETVPADLAAKGVILEQPAAGATITGGWVTVSGWADPAAVAGVSIIGAPVPAFYEATGHVGIPSVWVALRADGRFFAPRVPLVDGANTLTLLPLGRGGAKFDPITQSVTASDTAVVPATIVIDPPQPEPGKEVRLRAATATSASLKWHWDFDGDGAFDVETDSATHAWPSAGRYAVTARARINDQWVSAFSFVTVGSLPEATASANGIGAVSRLFVIPKFAEAAELLAHDTQWVGRTAIRFVVTIEGDAVKVYDAALAPLFTLPGLSKPSMVIGDPLGRLYVADTGHDRIVRFLPNGTLDPAFGTAGAFAGPPGLPFKAPVSLGLSPRNAELIIDAATRVVCANDEVDAQGSPTMGDWQKVTCSSVPLMESTRFKELGVPTLLHPVMRPSILFADEPRPELFITDSKLISNSDSYRLVEDVGPVVDAAMGRLQFRDDFAVVDKGGRVLLYREGRKVSSWSLGFEVTAIAAGPDGRLFVAGNGRLEARAFPPLR